MLPTESTLAIAAMTLVTHELTLDKQDDVGIQPVCVAAHFQILGKTSTWLARLRPLCTAFQTHY